MTKLSRAYIQAHQNDIHTYASLGETLFQTALRQAESILGTGEADKVEFNISVELTPFEPKDCIRICISTASGETWCMNQATDVMYQP